MKMSEDWLNCRCYSFIGQWFDWKLFAYVASHYANDGPFTDTYFYPFTDAYSSMLHLTMQCQFITYTYMRHWARMSFTYGDLAHWVLTHLASTRFTRKNITANGNIILTYCKQCDKVRAVIIVIADSKVTSDEVFDPQNLFVKSQRLEFGVISLAPSLVANSRTMRISTQQE